MEVFEGFCQKHVNCYTMCILSVPHVATALNVITSMHVEIHIRGCQLALTRTPQ